MHLGFAGILRFMQNLNCHDGHFQCRLLTPFEAVRSLIREGLLTPPTWGGMNPLHLPQALISSSGNSFLPLNKAIQECEKGIL